MARGDGMLALCHICVWHRYFHHTIFLNVIIILLKVYSHDRRHQVGKISKQWGGLMKEMFTNADNFGVSCK